MNAEDQNKEHSSEELVERHQIPGSPFTSVKHQDQYYLLMGKYRLNEQPLASHDEVIQYANDNEYDVILKMIMIVFNDLVEQGKRHKDTMKPTPTEQN